MDLTDEDAEDAMLFGGKLRRVRPVSLSGSYVMAGKDFGKGTLSKGPFESGVPALSKLVLALISVSM